MYWCVCMCRQCLSIDLRTSGHVKNDVKILAKETHKHKKLLSMMNRNDMIFG